jgi:hypothetical protein
MRARVEVVVFSLLLIAIVNLKLSIHALRKSDIGFLHKVNTKPPTFGLNTGPVIGDARHKAQTQDDRSWKPETWVAGALQCVDKSIFGEPGRK